MLLFINLFNPNNIVRICAFADGDAPEGRDIYPRSTVIVHNRGFRNRIMSSRYDSPLISGEKNSERGAKFGFSLKLQSLSGKNRAPSLTFPHHPPVVLTVENAIPRRHPCEKFSFATPPADKKRTGPRRKFKR